MDRLLLLAESLRIQAIVGFHGKPAPIMHDKFKGTRDRHYWNNSFAGTFETEAERFALSARGMVWALPDHLDSCGEAGRPVAFGL